MAVPTSITDCNATAANNSPAGSDSIGTSLDDYLRAHAAIIRQVSDDTLHLAGGTVTGQIKGITPVDAADLTRKDYVDTMLPKAGGTVTGQIKGITPVAAEDLARKDYVDSKLGTVPAFRVRLSAAQSISPAGWRKVNFDSEDFDTNGCFSSYSFIPNVAGYYQINCGVRGGATSSVPYLSIGVAIYKNGSLYSAGRNEMPGSSNAHWYNTIQLSDLVYLNGSTDSISMYVYSDYAMEIGSTFYESYTFLSGYLARS